MSRTKGGYSNLSSSKSVRPVWGEKDVKCRACGRKGRYGEGKQIPQEGVMAKRERIRLWPAEKGPENGQDINLLGRRGQNNKQEGIRHGGERIEEKIERNGERGGGKRYESSWVTQAGTQSKGAGRGQSLIGKVCHYLSFGRVQGGHAKNGKR